LRTYTVPKLRICKNKEPSALNKVRVQLLL